MNILFEVSDEHEFAFQRDLLDALKATGITPAVTSAFFQQQDRIFTNLKRQGYATNFVPHAQVPAKTWDLVVATGRRGDVPYRNLPTRVLLSVAGIDPRTGHHREAEIIREDRYQAYLAASEADMQACLKQMPTLFDGRHVRVVGRPMFDRLFSLRSEGKAKLAVLNLAPDLPTVLVISGADEAGLFRQLPAVVQLMNEDTGWNIVATGLPALWDVPLPGSQSQDVPRGGPRGGPGYWQWLVHYLRGPHRVAVGNQDVVSLLAASDVLVTDDPGVAQAFFALDRPVLFFNTVKARRTAIADEFDAAVRPFSTVEELRLLLHEAVKDLANRSAQRNQWCAHWLQNQAHSRQAAVEAIRQLALIPREDSVYF